MLQLHSSRFQPYAVMKIGNTLLVDDEEIDASELVSETDMFEVPYFE